MPKSTGSIVKRLADLARVLKLVKVTEEAMRLRNEI